MTPTEIKRAKELSAKLVQYGRVRYVPPQKKKAVRSLDEELARLGVRPKQKKKLRVNKIRPSLVPSSFPYESLMVKDGEPGKDGLNADPELVIQEVLRRMEKPEVDEEAIMEKLIERIQKEKLIDVSHLKNYESFVYNKTKYNVSELMHGGSNASSTAGMFYTPTGVVDASNTVFGVTAQPTSVVSDGITYFEGAGYSYNSGTNEITMDIAPSQYIKYTL